MLIENLDLARVDLPTVTMSLIRPVICVAVSVHVARSRKSIVGIVASLVFSGMSQ